MKQFRIYKIALPIIALFLAISVPSYYLYKEINKEPNKEVIEAPKGNDGKDGNNGITWYSGKEEPSSVLGSDNDYYLDLSTNIYYKKIDGKWIKQSSLKGDKGDKGNDGKNGKDGQNGKDGRKGNDGNSGKDGNDGDKFYTSFIGDHEHGKIIPSKGSAKENETITYKFIPDRNYSLSSITINNNTISSFDNYLEGNTYEYQTTMAYNGNKVSATFFSLSRSYDITFNTTDSSAFSKTFDGESVTISSLKANGDLLNSGSDYSVSYTKLNEDNGAYLDISEVKDAGTYKIKVTFTDDNDPYEFSYVINKLEVKIKNLTVNDKTYDGEKEAVILPIASYSNGLKGTDAIKINQIAAEFNDANVGVDKDVEVIGGTISAADNNSINLNNYKFTYDTMKGNIVKKDLSSEISNMEIKVLDKTSDYSMSYRGTSLLESEISIKYYSNTLTLGTDYTLSYKDNEGNGLTGVSDIKNANSYKIVINFINNYSGSKTIDFTINPYSFTVSSLTVNDKEYSQGNTTAIIANNQIVKTGIGEEKLCLTSITASFINDSVGDNKTVNITGAKLNDYQGSLASNYNVSYGTTIGNIYTYYTLTLATIGPEFKTRLFCDTVCKSSTLDYYGTGAVIIRNNQSVKLTWDVDTGKALGDYEFKGWYDGDTNELISSEGSYEFKMTGNRKITLKFERDVTDLYLTLATGDATQASLGHNIIDSLFGFESTLDDSITTVSFSDETLTSEQLSDTAHCKDVSGSRNGTSYLYVDETNNKLIITTNGSGEKLYGDDLSYYFMDMKCLQTVDFTNLDMSYATGNMIRMFYKSTALTSIDLTSLDLSAVGDLRNMFEESGNSETTLNLSNLTASSCLDMERMFYKYQGNTINLSNFNTGKTKYLNEAFYNCANLTTLNLTNFTTTSYLFEMKSLFSTCKKLTSIDMSSFYTFNVNRWDSMFYNCEKLTSVTFNSDLNCCTNKATHMINMFYGCKELVTLNLASFNTSTVIYMNSMFCDCKALTTIYATPKFDGNTCLRSGDKGINMFKNCIKLVGTAYDGTKTAYNSNQIGAAKANTYGYLTYVAVS